MKRLSRPLPVFFLVAALCAPIGARIVDESASEESLNGDLLSLETYPYGEVPIESAEALPASDSLEVDYTHTERPYDLIEYSPSVYAPIPQKEHHQPALSYEKSHPTYALSSEPYPPYQPKKAYHPPAASPPPPPASPHKYPPSKPYEPQYQTAPQYQPPQYQPSPPPAAYQHPSGARSVRPEAQETKYPPSQEYRPDVYAIIQTVPYTGPVKTYGPPAPSVSYSPKPQYQAPAPYSPPPRPSVEYKPRPSPQYSRAQVSHYPETVHQPQPYQPSAKSEYVKPRYQQLHPSPVSSPKVYQVSPPAYEPPAYRPPAPLSYPQTQHAAPQHSPPRRPSYSPPEPDYAPQPSHEAAANYPAQVSHAPAAYPPRPPVRPHAARPAPVRYPPPTPYIPPQHSTYSPAPAPHTYPSAYNAYNRQNAPYKSA